MKLLLFIALCILTIPLTSLANLTYDYTATAYSGYKWGTITETLSDTRQNGTATTFKSSNTPYRGGSQAYSGSLNSFMAAGLFYPRTSQNDGIWGSAEILGTITVDSSSGSSVLNINYSTAPNQPISANGALLIGRNNFSEIILDCSSVGDFSFSLPVQQYEQLDFYMWYSLGSAQQPFYNSNTFMAGVNATFALVPEPTTLLLIGLGGMFLRRRKS
jgi:hypothetical protein